MQNNPEQVFFHQAIEEGMYSSPRKLRFYLNYVFKDIPLENKNLLDVGSGKGLLTFYAAVRGARQVVCLEPEGNGSDRGVINDFNRFRSALAVQLPIEYQPLTLQSYTSGIVHQYAFDIVLLHNSINHLDEEACIHLLEREESYNSYLKIFTDICHLMVKGGKLLVLDCSCYNLFPLLGIRNFISPSIEWHKHQAPETWITLFRKAGFKNPQISWTTPNRLGRPGQLLMGNRWVAHLTRSHFKINMEK